MIIGRRFLVRPTHLPDPVTHGRIVLRLDAGLAFGSGEHASTRGCLLAFEGMAHRRPRRILDLGSGSGILGIAAAKWFSSTPVTDASAHKKAKALEKSSISYDSGLQH